MGFANPQVAGRRIFEEILLEAFLQCLILMQIKTNKNK